MTENAKRIRNSGPVVPIDRASGRSTRVLNCVLDGREFVVFNLFNVLFDAAAVLETESKIVCADQIALLTTP
jgi:hypothetical protein